MVTGMDEGQPTVNRQPGGVRRLLSRAKYVFDRWGWLVAVLVVIGVVLSGLLDLGGALTDPDTFDGLEPDIVEVGKVRDLEGNTLDGEKWRLSDLQDRRVAVLWWHPWCDECLQALDEFQRVADSATHGVEFVAAIDDDFGFEDAAKDAAHSLVAEKGITFTVVEADNFNWVSLSSSCCFDGKTTWRGIPMVFLIDEAGMVVTKSPAWHAIPALLDQQGW
jgi:thiol-disulfide isomerase/thioredoxin